MKKSTQLEIFLFYHKKSHILLDNRYFTPVQVGLLNNPNIDLGCEYKDDIGENISHLNSYVAEYSGWYTVWKNVKIQSDYVGFGHYRRLACINKDDPTVFIATDMAGLMHDQENFGFSNENISEFLYKYDILFPKKNFVNIDGIIKYADGYLRKSFDFYSNDEIRKNTNVKDDLKTLTMREHYYACHRGEDFELMLDIIKQHVDKKRYQKILSIADTCGEHNGNLPIMRKEVFYNFMEWVEPIRIELFKKLDLSIPNKSYQRRVFGFLSERLFNLFAYSSDYRIYNELPIICIEEPEFSMSNSEDNFVKVDIEYLMSLTKLKMAKDTTNYKYTYFSEDFVNSTNHVLDKTTRRLIKLRKNPKRFFQDLKNPLMRNIFLKFIN